MIIDKNRQKTIIELGKSYYNRYFKDSQFNCKCGCGLNNMDMQFLYKIAYIRNTLNFPFVITSGSRCQKHNNIIKGSIKSAHLSGQAVDIQVVNSKKRFLLINQLLKLGFNRIGIGKDFIHVDCKNQNGKYNTWVY